MTTNRVILALMAILVLMQGYSLVKSTTIDGQTPGPSRPYTTVIDAPENAEMDISDLPMKGNKTARVVLAEFSDFECPYCSRYARDTAPKIDKGFVETGKVKAVFLHNPLPFHPNARLFATAAICANQQARFWDLYDLMFHDGPTSAGDLLQMSKRLSFQDDEFQKCLDNKDETEKLIERDSNLAAHLGLTGTPGFAIGSISSNGKVRIRRLITGALPFEVFERELNAEIGKVASRPF